MALCQWRKQNLNVGIAQARPSHNTLGPFVSRRIVSLYNLSTGVMKSYTKKNKQFCGYPESVFVWIRDIQGIIISGYTQKKNEYGMIHQAKMPQNPRKSQRQAQIPSGRPRVQENGSNLRFLLDNSLDQLKDAFRLELEKFWKMDPDGWNTVQFARPLRWPLIRPSRNPRNPVKNHDVLRCRNASLLRFAGLLTRG